MLRCISPSPVFFRYTHTLMQTHAYHAGAVVITPDVISLPGGREGPDAARPAAL